MIPSEPIPVLFTHYGDQWMRGSERVLLDLLAHLDPARVQPIVWCNGTELAATTAAMGVPTHRTDFAYYLDARSPPLNPVRYAGLVREGLGLVRRYGARVLHANSAAPAQWLVPVARLSRRPLLVHLHISYLRRSRYALLLHKADLLVGVSRQVVDDFLSDGVPEERLQVIYNGIDCARLQGGARSGALRRQFGIAPEALVIAAVGSLIHRKGHDVLLRALSCLNHSDIHLWIAGDGSDWSKLEGLTRELGLAARVRFLGFLDDVPGVLRSADIVALASRAEAFGLVLAEAGAFGLPVVSTLVGGIPEVIAQEETSLLVPPDDPTALAAALGRLAIDPALRHRLGAAGRERVGRLFSVQQMAAAFHDTYDRLAQGAAIGPRTGMRPYWRLLSGSRQSAPAP